MSGKLGSQEAIFDFCAISCCNLQTQRSMLMAGDEHCQSYERGVKRQKARGCVETELNMNISKVAPELQRPLRRIPPVPIGSAPGRRLIRALGRLMPATRLEGVTIEQRNNLQPRLRIYRPTIRHSKGALYWIHGGGMVIGSAAQDDRLCASTSRELGIVVVSVEYHLAPEYPFPLPLDDCHAGWLWLQQAASSLGVDSSLIAIGGESAGGGLAASLVQRLHDEHNQGGLPVLSEPIAQWLFCPMLDDRTAARRELDSINHRVWNNRLNRIGWRAFLGVKPGSSHIPQYAAAARREDLRGLAPAWIGVGDIELFFAEDRAYAERLRAAEVDVTLDIVLGAPHGFENWAADTKLARDYIARAQAWLRRTLQDKASH
jgi:acetyl esterase/lipase